MLGRLTQAGWEVVDAPEAAQLLLVNTCGFIQEACREAVDTILELARHKEADPGQSAWWSLAAWCSAMARPWPPSFRKSIISSGCMIFRPWWRFWTGDRGPGTGGSFIGPRLTATASPRPATPPRRGIGLI